ncbi:site-specific integrase [Butyricicoccus pullicaecorum]|nr:site-specific integrase [Butyricicoccus pullicaecorum]
MTLPGGYDINGKQIIRSMTWTPDPGMTKRQVEKELERQKVLFEEKVRAGQVVDGTTRLSDYAERWFREYVSVHLKPTTQENYRILWKRVAPALGHLRMDKIRPHHLNAFYLNLMEDGIRDDVMYQCDDFKAITKAAGKTAAELTKETGLGIRTLYSLNAGNAVKPDTAEKLSAALGLPLSALFRPTRDKQALTHCSVNHYHKFLSSMFRTAVKQGVMAENPCAHVDAPSAGEEEPAYLDENDAAKLIEALDAAPMKYRVMIFLLLDTGMRRGELLGLEWKDIDFDRCTITIRRNSVYLPGQGVITQTPKTRRSARTVKVPQDCIDMLRQYRTHQLQERLKLGDQWEEHDRLFTTWNGRPLHPSSVTGWFTKFARAAELPEGVTIHSLRHTNATLLIAAGVNVRTVSARLGHAHTSTTMDIYSHAIQSADAAASDAIGSVVHRKKKRKA